MSLKRGTGKEKRDHNEGYNPRHRRNKQVRKLPQTFKVQSEKRSGLGVQGFTKSTSKVKQGDRVGLPRTPIRTQRPANLRLEKHRLTSKPLTALGVFTLQKDSRNQET